MMFLIDEYVWFTSAIGRFALSRGDDGVVEIKSVVSMLIMPQIQGCLQINDDDDDDSDGISQLTINVPKETPYARKTVSVVA
jgi:hypothetical protein